MARLIPQKQIEEINIFKDSISVNNSVFISGSLLVSQSFDLGSDPTTIQRITGSLEITGSLTLDGPLTLSQPDIRLEATASFADVSLDTRLFGGIRPEDFGAMDATLYVSSTSGDDNNDGRTQQFPLRTIKKAAKIATDGDDGRYGLPTGSLFTGFRIEVAAGNYLEDNPIELPKNTTVWGAGLRVTKVLAKNETEDLFWVNSGNYLAEMTFGNLRVFPSVDNSQKGFAVSFAPNAFITTSPYVQNCSMISNQENSFLEAYEPIPPGGGGLNVDGNRIHPDSPLASMVLDAYTQVAPNGVGCQVVGRGFIQLVSFFTNFSAYSVKVLDGGQAVLLNSNTSFGNFGMFASGSRFITGSGGNQDAFLNVQDNYSIIVNTIEQGLDAIPEMVPNTENGIRATDPLEYPQYFVSEDSTAEVAEIVKSDFRIVSSIIETGDSNIPSLLAKSSTRGYNPTTVYNVSGQTQYTASITASQNDVDSMDTNFNILLSIIEDGNVATASYTQISSVSESIKVSNIVPIYGGVGTETTQNIVNSHFDTIINIVANGLTASPTIISNNSASFAFVATASFYETDISSSLSTIQNVSASFALVYDIVENGTGSLPTIILSSSIENPLVEIQNAYTLLINNIPFIQSETIAYLSSSWSEFEYNEASCSRDIGFIVSGVAHDLLYGGNEESLRNGIFYYQFPSDATSVQLDPTLTGIKYASELTQNILRGREFRDTNNDIDISYQTIFNNKDFVREETIAYISSSWSEFVYDEAKCRRDIGYILDAVATDLKYDGNERSVIAGQFYYKYPSLAIVDNRTTGQLQQTLDAIKYAKRITQKLLNNDTFETASDSRQSSTNLLRLNRSLIQDETITYINTQYPNFDYNQTKCRRDVGYIVDNIATDLLYGGNERTELAGLYYFLFPSIANTTQLTETLEAVRYINGISKEIIQSNILDTPQIILNTDGNIRVTVFDSIKSSVSGTETEVRLVSQSYGIIEDVIRHGTDSILGAIGSNSDNFNWNLYNPINVTNLTQVAATADVSSSLTSSIFNNIQSIIDIIGSGSSITTEVTIGTDSKGTPISTVGIPKNSYGDNLITTVVGTILPDSVTIVKNTEGNVKVGNDTQYTSSISASISEIQKVSSSFSIVTDIIRYGISGSLEISGSSDVSTYFEVVSIEGTPNAFYFNKNQLQKFDDADGKILGENTGSFEDGVQDPTLTLKRGEMYTFSINNLKIERATPLQLQPFYIKTERVAGTSKQYNKGVTNNGISFGTITFIVPFDAPNTLYYVNANNVSASGVFNVVDDLPLSDTQRYVQVPSLGFVEVVTNNVDNIKISNLEQYSSSFSTTPSQSLQISGSFATIINILEEGLDEIPTLVKNVSGLIKKTNITQYTSSIDTDSNLRNSVSASFNIVLDIVRNGTGSIPTIVSNTEGNIKFTTTSQFTGSLSGSIEDIEFVSSSISIVTDIITFGSGSYETASNYVSISTEPSTLAAYEIIKENIPFIQIETIAYLSSSWKGFEYNEASCSRDIGLIISGAAEDLLWGVPSASIVNGKYYFEFPSAATSSQLNQTLDGINYASRLTQTLIQNIVYTTASLDVRNSYDILIENRPLIQAEAVAYVSSSWSGVYYNEVSCSRDVGFIVDAVATDLLYGGNERSSKAGEFYYLFPSRATNGGIPSEQNQLDSTLSGINYARLFSNELLQNNIFTAASTQIIEVTKLITENKPLIQSEVITYISSSWSNFEYNEASCSRDVGYILDAVATDFFYGGNERSITAGTFYYLFPSAATGSQLTQTVDGITYAQRLTNKLINNVILENPSDERTATYNLLFNNKGLLQNEVISYISSSWSGFEYIESKCRRDVGFIVDAVATDVLYGGNERSVKAGEFYYLFPSEATTTQVDQTIDGVHHSAELSEKIIQNIELQNPAENTRVAYNTILNNREFIQDNVIEFIDVTYPYLTYNRVKCRRDVGHIVDAIVTDLLWGGNQRSVIAGDYYYRFPSQATGVQLRETIDAIIYTNTLIESIITNNVLPTPRVISNTENNIRFTNTERYSGSLAISGSYISEISSSFESITDIIENGLSVLPTEVRNVDGLVKVTAATQITLSNSGSDVEVGIVSASIGMINDIIRLGSNNIPFSIAKWFQTSELDTPQNLTTSSYVTASGTFVEVDILTELEIVSESFELVNTIISSGTGSIPQVVSNVASNIKVSGTEQYTLNTNGSQTEVSIVSASVDIIERIVQNGLSVVPLVIENNTNINNLIKVGTEPQIITGSLIGNGKLQSKIVSASFGLVIDIIVNGTASTPPIKEYITQVNAPDTVLAYELLKENTDFIQEETILFMSSSWSSFMYDEEKCRRDIGFIVSGSAEDLIWNSNSASIVNGKFYLEYPSAATGSQLDQTITAIKYASNLAQNIVRNREYVTASLEVSSSYQLLVQNKQFVKDETIEFISSSWSNFLYNQETCKRDVGFIIDAVATDLLYGGNERSVTAGRYYYDYPSAAIVGGIPSATQQKDPTVTAINYVKGLLSELVDGAVFVTTSAEVDYVYNSLRLNRGFIQNETIAFVNAKYPNLQYNEASCSRDTGFIVDAVATDLRYGGNQRSVTAGEFYYRFPSIATSTQLGETTDAIIYTSDLVREIILQNELPKPTASLNTDFNIKSTLVPQIAGTGTSESRILSHVSASFGLVMDIITNGTGSLPTLTEYTASLSDLDTLNAYNIVQNNIEFIKSEVIAYISSSWSGFEYNEASCSRDTGFIVSGAIEDLLWNANSASIVNGKYYFEFPSEATGSQLSQTLDGIRYAAGLTNKIIQGVTLEFPSTEASASWELLRRNKSFIQSESIAYISSSWSGFSYNEETCKRDVGYIVDAIATDIKYGGIERSVTAGDFYYIYPSSATNTQLEPTTTGIGYAGDVAEKVIVNEVFETSPIERIAGNETLIRNRAFIQNEVIAYISSSWSNFEYNEASCSRDVGYIIDAVATDLLYGGNERSRTAGEYYYKFPSSATVAGVESPNINAQLYPTLDGIKYASGISQKLVQNIEFVTASNEVSASWHLLRDNKEFIQNEVIAYVSSSWSGVYYAEEKCKRDVGYLIDAVATDIYYGGNERSVTAGSFYYLFPSRATNKGVPSEQNQLDPTIDGINYAKGLSQKVIQNTEFVQPSASVLVGADLLIGNREFIQKEVITFLSSSWSEFEYNEASCSRDVGYIIDAVRTDLVYGGNERSIQAGRFYYYIPSVATTEQKPQTIDGIDFAKGIAEKVVIKQQLVRPSLDTRISIELLKSRKKDLQSKAISYTNGAFPNFVYNEEKCYRDTGFIVDAIATDLFYGGNERSIEAASSYYNGVYGSAAVVITEQKLETAETNRYLRTQFQRIVRNSPLELFGSLIITTGHDFSYAGAGVTYKALPPNQGGAGVPDPTKEIIELDGGRVFFTAGNELGDFKIGTGLTINQATGTLQGRTFSRSLFSLVTPFSLALEG
jgi:hypothetical protein